MQDKGAVFNYDLTEGLELGYLLDLAECLVIAGRARDREPRGALRVRTTHSRRRQLDEAHARLPREDDGSVRLGYKEVDCGKYLPMERKY